MKILIPQAVHSGYLYQLISLFPEHNFILSGSKWEGLDEPIMRYPLKLDFAGVSLEKINLDDYDKVIAVWETHHSSPVLRGHPEILWRILYTPQREKSADMVKVVYASDYVRQASVVPGLTIMETRDENVFTGWKGKDKQVLTVVKRLNAGFVRYYGCGAPLIEQVSRKFKTCHVDGDMPFEELVRLYKKSRVFLEASPRRQDFAISRIFSGSFIEAMFTGTPIVTIDGNEFGLLVENGINGFKAVRPEKILAYIKLLMEDENLAERISKNEQELARIIFSKKRTRDLWERALEETPTLDTFKGEEVTIFGWVGKGFGGIANMPSYLAKAFSSLGAKVKLNTYDRIFVGSLNKEERELIRKQISDSSDLIIYLHVAGLSGLTDFFLTEARAQRKKVITFPTDFWIDRREDTRRIIYEKSWKVIAHSKKLLEKRKEESKNKEALFYVPWPMREARIFEKEEREKIKEALGIKTKNIIGLLGFVKPQKGLPNPLLSILKELDNTSLLIVGTVDYTWSTGESLPFIQEIEKEIDRLELRNRVVWINRPVSEKEIDTYLSCCDVLLVPTNPQTDCPLETDTLGTFSTVLGINGGKCLLATKQETRNEILDDNPDSFIIEDFESWILVLRKLLSGSYKNYEKNAGKVVSKYSWKEFARTLLQIFQEE